MKLLASISICGTLMLVVACQNTGGGAATSSGGSGTAANGTKVTGPSAATGSGAVASFTMTTAIATPAGGASGATGAAGASGAPLFTLIFNAINQTKTLNDVCQVQNAGGNFDPARACKCRYAWTETNQSDTSVITRIVETDPKQVTAFQVQCDGPDVFDTEIPDGTIIKITLVPNTASGNNTGFSTNTLNFTKAPIVANGDFRDAEGRSFRNVFHYTCFDKTSKALGITHSITKGPANPTTGIQPDVPLANSFRSSSGGGSSAFSGQSYYFDFYVRSNELGSINASTPGFTCPQVNINGLPSFFPLDSTFALSLQKNDKDFPVTVQAISFLPSGASGAVTSGILGFAAKPNSDGTCPSFTDANGKIKRTFRLRQFTSIYPLRFKEDGDLFDNAQRINTVFILDRPVDKVGQDPLKPITRMGPKPCPFSFKTAQFGQKCTADASLAGFNVDGIQIQGNPGCPIYPPVDPTRLKPDGTLVIRPFKPFVPNYLENAQFKACAFPSSSAIDPEIVLSHDDNIFPIAAGPNDFYCAKHYAPAGAILPSPNGDPFDKAPGDCDLAMSAAVIKTNKTYACSRTFNPTNSPKNTPAAGCCQICSGPNCTAQGGGTTAAGRNAAFSPPFDIGNPPQAIKLLPRGTPNAAGGGGCFDPFED